MEKKFDRQEAKKKLLRQEQLQIDEAEAKRREILDLTMRVLNDEFSGQGIEVYLVGSLITPYGFNSHSDIDIVLRNFSGDRFEIWAHLEGKINRTLEIILFEKCEFKEYILEKGMRVV